MSIDLGKSRNLVSQADQAHIEPVNVPRSTFHNQWTRKTAFHAGYLIPIMVDEILPGDHMRYSVTAYLRMSTPLFPLFDNQRVDTFFFFVPARLLWNNWHKFMGEQETPGDSISYLIPKLVLPAGGPAVGDIADHMGIPTVGQIAAGASLNVNALPFRAYNLIWNQWFRDENLINPLVVSKTDGPDNYINYGLAYRAKSHDYFTTALPWPQKFTAPTIPITGLAPIQGIGLDFFGRTHDNATYYTTQSPAGATFPYSAQDAAPVLPPAAAANQKIGIETDSSGVPKIYADLSATAGIDINSLRQAWMIQGLLERDARGGTRYVEKIRAQFGVISPDFRLARPEYIGGGQTPLQITPIAQTAPTTGVPLGALGAAGTAAGTHSASYAATEHGYVIGLINVRTEISYQQGLHKLWARGTQYSFYTPALAGLGEQAITRQEIYCTGVPANDDVVFGYQERWQEYRTRYNEVTGIMRSTAAGTLDAWHLAQKFATAPLLNQAFINDIAPMARVLAAGTNANGQQYLADIMFRRTAVRPIPIFGTPAPLSRF